MLADIVTARCLLYLDNLLAVPFSLNSTRLESETKFPVFSDRTNILLKLSLFFLSSKYCCKMIGYSFPSLLNFVTVLPPYKVSSVCPIASADIPKSFAFILLIFIFTSGLFLL